MVNTTFEVLINKLLKEHDLLLVADTLLKKWNQNDLNRDEKICVALFLLNSGLHSTLKNQILHDLSQNREVIWPALCLLISKYPHYFREDIVNPIMIGLLESDHLADILLMGEFVKIHPRFQSTYEKILAERSKDLGINYLQLKNILNKKEIDELLKEKSNIDTNSSEYKKIISSFEQNAKKYPDQAYEIAISLAQIESYKAALYCLNLAPDSTKKDWLTIELHLQNKDYIKVVDISFELEKKYANEPDTVIETLLLRSKAYIGLQEVEKAKQILNMILKVIPKNFKARALLSTLENE